MDTNWIQYKCKSGQILLVFNKITGEFKWPNDCSGKENSTTVMLGEPVINKELCTTGTQTDDTGCINGCTSMYISASNIMNTKETSTQEMTDISDEIPDINVDIESDIDNGLDGEGIEEKSTDIDEMLESYWECDENSFNIKAINELKEHDYCEQTFVCNFEDHVMRAHAKKMPLECSYCKRKFRVKKNLEKHQRTFHTAASTQTGETASIECASGDGEPVIYDQLDNSGLEEQRRYMDKTLNTSKEIRYSNSYLDKDNIEAITHHFQEQLQENEVKRFKCHQCEKAFICNSLLESHIARLHNKEKPFECSLCKHKFVNKKNMKKHIQTQHLNPPKEGVEGEEEKLECSYCKKKLSSKKSLKEHIRMHTGEKPFECSYCKKKFTRKHVLKDHLRTHTGDRPFECFLCKKKYRYKMTLKDHLRMHTGERPFECSYCKKKFASKKSLNVHIKIHIDKRIVEELRKSANSS